MSTKIPASTLERITTFGDLLRFLRRRTGLTQLELSIVVGYSDAQISRLEQNLRLPDIPTIEARFIPALHLEDEPQAVARLLELAANVRREDVPGLGICPYKGLNFFDETDADLFAGRETLTGKLVERVLNLVTQGEGFQVKFLAIIGASGSGKSSLVRAGLIPVLRWNQASANWPIQVITPTARPLESLAVSLTQEAVSVTTTAALLDDLTREPRSLSLTIQRLLISENAPYLLLVVDQFEELFTLCRSEGERASFIENLLTAASEGPVIVLITLRADFYAHCANYPALRAILARQQEYIGGMSAEEMRRAIDEPAQRGRWEFEEGLVDLILHDVGQEPGALPLLSHALLETWQRRRGRMMTLSGYTSSGGVRGAIAETAEAIFMDRFSPQQQSIARRIFLRLTELGDETASGDTRRRASLDELILNPEEKATIQGVIKALADARLVTTGTDSVEVAHEALIREWPTLRGWLEEDREALRLHRNLTEATGEWLTAKRDPDLLYRGARLFRALEWGETHAEDMNPLEHEFLKASQALSEQVAAEREIQRQRELEAAQRLAEAERQRAEGQAKAARQLRRRAFYLGAALIIALGLAFTALFFSSQARQATISALSQQRIANSRELAAAALSNIESDPEQGILLALEALETTYREDQSWTAEAEQALRRSLQAFRLVRTLEGHSGEVWDAAFSLDGNRLATLSSDGTARILDTETWETLFTLPTGNTHGFSGLAFSPDGTWLATSGGLGKAILWDTQTGQEEQTFQGHLGWVTSVAFSPDGSRLASSGEDRAVKIWDLSTGQEVAVLFGHTEEVWEVAFSPDGEWLASASSDGSVKIWAVDTGEEHFTLKELASSVTSVIFSPDGSRLAAGGINGEAIVWNSATRDVLLTLHGHTDAVTGLDFSPDGSRMVTAGLDKKIKVWDTQTGRELFALNGHTGPVSRVVFSPDCLREPGAVPEQCGTLLASASGDGTVKVWNASFSQELLTFSDPGSTSGALDPHGRLLATGKADGEINVWDLSSAIQTESPLKQSGGAPGILVLSFNDHEGPVNALAFSLDGRRLASGGEDRLAKIWNLETGEEILALQGHTAGIADIAFSPDGSRLATSGSDNRVIVWDLNTGRAILTIENTVVSIPAIDFSPDGTRLAGGLTDGTVKVWNLETGEQLETWRGHVDGIYDISYNQDGTRLATASDDGTARVWDAGTNQELLTLSGHTGWVNGVAFSPDGSRLATAGEDGELWLWESDSGQPVLTLPLLTESIIDVAFSPDGTRLVIQSQSGAFHFYLLQIEDLLALGHARVSRSFTVEECEQYLHFSPETCLQEYASPDQTTIPEAPSPLVESSRTGRGKVCEITDPSGVNGLFYNQLTYQGLQEAASVFGWETIVVEPRDSAEYEKSLVVLVESGCDLIVAPTSIFFPEIFREVAYSNPGQKFLVFEWGEDQLEENVWVQYYDTNQAAFMAGYTAAAITESGKVGTFGGVQIPEVTQFMDGFALGVSYFNKRNSAQVEVLGWDVENQEGLFSGSFEDTEEARRMAEQILGEGADILLPVAGDSGIGAAAAVKERERTYVIGVDQDWAEAYPEYAQVVLTSIEKRLGATVLSAVGGIESGTFTGGFHLGTLEDGSVGLAPFHHLDASVPGSVRAELEEIQVGILRGEIKTQP